MKKHQFPLEKSFGNYKNKTNRIYCEPIFYNFFHGEKEVKNFSLTKKKPLKWESGMYLLNSEKNKKETNSWWKIAEKAFTSNKNDFYESFKRKPKHVFESVFIEANRFKDCSTVKEGILIKIKRFTDDEGIVIGFVELFTNLNEPTLDAFGKQKRSSKKENLLKANKLGALIVKSRKNDSIVFNIGSGFSESQRVFYWETRDNLIGKFVKYKYFEIGETGVPRFPTFVEFREVDDIS